MGSEHAEVDKLRGTGRTLAMVNTLPETGGATVVVHTRAMADYLKLMVRNVRSAAIAKATRIVIVNDRRDVMLLRGLSGPLFVDHAVWDARLPLAVYSELVLLQNRMNRKAAE